MNPRISRAALLGAMILVVLGNDITGAETKAPPYNYGDCSKATILNAWADCRVDAYSGKVGVAVWAASVGSAAARGQVGTTGTFNNPGYYTISCPIKYVAKWSRTGDWWIAWATLHANLFVDGTKYTDDYLAADEVWPWEMRSIWQLWSAPRNRSHTITRRVYLARGQHTLHCGLEDRAVASFFFCPWCGHLGFASIAMVAVGDATRISW